MWRQEKLGSDVAPRGRLRITVTAERAGGTEHDNGTECGVSGDWSYSPFGSSKARMLGCDRGRGGQVLAHGGEGQALDLVRDGGGQALGCSSR